MNNTKGKGQPSIYDEESIQSLKRHKRHPKKCPNCLNYTYLRHDTHTNQLICENCGFVESPKTNTSSGVSTENHTPTPEPDREHPAILIDKEEYDFLTNKQKYNRIWNLQQKYESKTGEDARDYRLEGYKATAGSIKSYYMMTKKQLNFVNNILEKLRNDGGLHKLHTRSNSEKIILSLCIFSMWRDWRNIDINTDPLCREIGLNIRTYTKIIENLFKKDSWLDEGGVE